MKVLEHTCVLHLRCQIIDRVLAGEELMNEDGTPMTARGLLDKTGFDSLIEQWSQVNESGETMNPGIRVFNITHSADDFVEAGPDEVVCPLRRVVKANVVEDKEKYILEAVKDLDESGDAIKEYFNVIMERAIIEGNPFLRLQVMMGKEVDPWTEFKFEVYYCDKEYRVIDAEEKTEEEAA